MKNIHLIPTDKPSKLYTIKGRYYIEEYPVKSVTAGNQHIYITNSEEIKEGDWCYFISTKEIIRVPSGGFKGNVCKKVILSTDQDLIADGVQAIPDTFLEWFVKNPSCEYVEVENHYRVKSGTIEEHKQGVAGYEYYEYKIIIPKEEPKQLFYKGDRVLFTGKILNEEVIDERETIEEASKRAVKSELFKDETLFIAGVKWQQERSFSNEEVKNIANWAFGFYKRNDLSDTELEEEFEKLLSEKVIKK